MRRYDQARVTNRADWRELGPLSGRTLEDDMGQAASGHWMDTPGVGPPRLNERPAVIELDNILAMDGMLP
jgi:hypothetical protein